MFRASLASRFAGLITLLMAISWSCLALAADTTECYDVGPTDVEMYLGLEGLGRPATEQTLGNQLVLGYGLTPRLSGYFSLNLSGDGYLMNPGTETAVGLYGTPLDTDNLDLDVFLGFSTQGAEQFTAGPGLELNWDAAPDLASRGLYVRSGLSFSGRSTATGPERTSDLKIVLGGYWTLAPGKQLLLEFDCCLENRESHLHGIEKEWSTGGWALGYNADLTATIELISQVYLDIPDDGEHTGLGMMLGFIATVSSNQDTPAESRTRTGNRTAQPPGPGDPAPGPRR